MTPGPGQPPRAKRVMSRRTCHGDTVVDEYAWLQDRSDPDTMAYLHAETAYAATATEHLEPLRQAILEEFRIRTQETDLTVPARKGGYWYYNRAEAGQQHIVHCRVPVSAGVADPPDLGGVVPLPDEEVLIDRNVLADGSAYFNLGVFDVSPDGRLLAYGADYTGEESFVLRVKDLVSGTLLPDEIPDVCYGSAWSADGGTLLYTTADSTGRPHRVRRHRLGTPPQDDPIVHEEQDPRFRVAVALSRSRRFILVTIRSRTSSEVLFVPADTPDAAPRVIARRRDGVDYTVDHQDERFLVLHNADGENFALAQAPVDDPCVWSPLIPHRSDTRLLQVHAFARHFVVAFRRDGTTGLRVVPQQGGAPPYDISLPDPLHTARPERNLDYDATTFRLHFSSLTTPDSIYDCDVGTGTLLLRKQTRVLDGFRADRYEQHREWAVAPDGTRVPVSVVVRRGTPRDGSAAAVLYGYGAYELSLDPSFSLQRLSLLDRGVVFAIAHTRGGGELGRRWYEDGRLLRKKNTFTDFISVARHLVTAGWAAPGRVVARGASAGGLLMGAVANDLDAATHFAGIAAEVPFVDPLTTVLDPSRPLAVNEWEEWGNPRDDPEAYAYMKSYAPYDNVADQAYPPLLVTTSLNDTRVLCHEPAKWVARLRAMSPSTSVLLRVDMHGGHSGSSGRYRAWADEAFMTAWILDRVGAPIPFS